jgi:hypothetical protein
MNGNGSLLTPYPATFRQITPFLDTARSAGNFDLPDKALGTRLFFPKKYLVADFPNYIFLAEVVLISFSAIRPQNAILTVDYA